jgi:hypothetical protein
MDCPNGFDRTVEFLTGMLFAFLSLMITVVGVMRFVYPWLDSGQWNSYLWTVSEILSTSQIAVSSIVPLVLALTLAIVGGKLMVKAAKETPPRADNDEFRVRYSMHSVYLMWVQRISAAINLFMFSLFGVLLGLIYTISLLTGQWWRLHCNAPGWACALFLPLLIWACWDASRERRFILTKKGIDVDSRGPSTAIHFCFRWLMPWSDLHSVTILRTKKESQRAKNGRKINGKLALDFGSGVSRYMDLSVLTKEELDGLFQAFERWADKLTLSPEVLALKDYVLLGEDTALQAEEKKTSFTQIWEQSLHGRHASTAYMPLSPGRTLQDGRITIISQVCSSGLSAVYLAETKQKQRVILKECFVTPSSSAEKKAKAEELFKRESALLARLSHPQIAKLMDVFEENGRSYIVMQHISGTNLRQLVANQGPQPEQVVLRWAQQILDVVEFLHTQDPPIIHRDLTPDNLVLSASDQKVNVVDFGAANEFLGKATGTLIGKQCYIAPEQFRGKAQTQSDLYALGATMHFLLTGKDPEPLESSRPVEANPAVSLEVSGLVEWCTNQEAELRPTTAADLKHAIQDISDRLEQSPKPGESDTIAIGLKNILRIRARQES